MGIICSCDYDPPEFHSSYIRTAAKSHQCYECSGEIAKGENYEYAVGKWNGDVSTFKTCERCVDLRKWMTNNIPCFCFGYGNLHDDAKETIVSAQEQAPEETKGLYFALLRRLVAIDHLNKVRSPVSPLTAEKKL